MMPQDPAAAPEAAVAEDPIKVQNAPLAGAPAHPVWRGGLYRCVGALRLAHGHHHAGAPPRHHRRVAAGREIALHFLTTMCGINYPENVGQELGMIYHLHSLTQTSACGFKIFFPVADPVVPTLSDIYLAANWMEREAYDFYGVIFTGHPNLMRILNVEGHGLFPHAQGVPARRRTREDKTDLFFGR